MARRRWNRTTGTLIPHGFEVQALNLQSGCEDRTHDLWIINANPANLLACVAIETDLSLTTPNADFDFSNFLVLSLSDANTSERVCGVQAKIHTRGSTSLLRRQLEEGKSNKFSELWHQK